MQTPPDIPEAVKMMRALGITELSVTAHVLWTDSIGERMDPKTVTIKLGPLPPDPNAKPQTRTPSPLAALAGGTRLRLRPTQADATKAPMKDESDEPGA